MRAGERLLNETNVDAAGEIDRVDVPKRGNGSGRGRHAGVRRHASVDVQRLEQLRPCF